MKNNEVLLINITNLKLVICIFCIVLLTISCSTEKETKCGELNFNAKLQPVPQTAKFINDNYFIWGGSLIKSEHDGKYHMFYSRWPKELGMSAWVTHSEVAHAVSDSPFGPFEFSDVALSVRGEGYWDGLVTHNPTIHYFDGHYYLYYTGNIGFTDEPGEYWEHRNRQRIGFAKADNPYGPWERFNQPLIDVSADSLVHDALITTNPSVVKMPDGRFLMVYKAAAKITDPPRYGPVVHLTAISDSPSGPFEKQMQPIFTAGDVDFPAEDPYVWFQDNCYYAILKDMEGDFTQHGTSLVLFYSENGFDWDIAPNALVSKIEINWEGTGLQELQKLERPQLYIENGELIALLCAARETLDHHSFNVQIPLKKLK
jgi:hypothetical protein